MRNLAFQICVVCMLAFLNCTCAAEVLLDFEDAPTGPLNASFYSDSGVIITGASIFRVPLGSWVSARSGVQGIFPSNAGTSIDGTSWQSVIASHGINQSNAGGAIADVQLILPGTSQKFLIESLSIGYGYDSDGGESFQAVVIQAFDSLDNMVLNVARPNLYYDGYETFSAPGAVRLRLTQNGYVGFDDLSFTIAYVVPEPSTSIFAIGSLATLPFIRRRRCRARVIS
jgi:hypothetical protein